MAEMCGWVFRWSTSNTEQQQIFAKELVGLQPDVILAHGTPVTAACGGKPARLYSGPLPTRSVKAASTQLRQHGQGRYKNEP